MTLNNLRCSQFGKKFASKLFEVKKLQAKNGAQLLPDKVAINSSGDTYDSLDNGQEARKESRYVPRAKLLRKFNVRHTRRPLGFLFVV
jgi:hypothetical protein